jgi:hypothetical protein
MGGILSSSSELMGATQRFEPGGVVNAGEGLTPIATVGNRRFFLTQDGRSIVDGEGRAVRDPSVLRAIMQQDQGATAPTAEEELFDSRRAGVMAAAQPQLPPEPRPTYQTPELSGLESFAQSQPVSEEVSNQMRVLDMAKAGASINQMAQTTGVAIADIANIIAGSASLLVTEGAALAADVAGLVSGGGDVSKFAFEGAQDLRDFGRNTYIPDTNSGNLDDYAPRLFMPKEEAPEVDRLAQIEADSLRNIGAGDEALFAEGAPVEQLGDNFPSSIIEARNTGAPQIPDFDSELASSQILGSQRSSFDAPEGGTSPDVAGRPAMPGRMDVSTGVPMTMDEIQSSTLREREDAANRGLGVPTEQEDRFPQEDQRLAEQEAQMANISNIRRSAQERMQMTMPEAAVTPAPEAAVTPAPEDGGFTPRFPGDVPEAAELQRRVEEAEASTAVTPAPPAADAAPPATAPPPMDIDTDQLGADIDSDPANAGFTASTAILGSAGVDTSGMGIQERTVAMRDMLDGLMGQTDAQEKEEFWMNMAMVGFGIAAGESSNAMKNIADGLLAGTAQISKGNAAKRDRNDQFTLTAFGEVLADQRAQEKFDRDVTLAGIRSSGSGSIYGDRKDPLTAMYQLAQTMYADGSGDYLTLPAAIDAARIQIEQDYGITLPRGGDTGGGGGEDMVTIEQGGQRIQIPRSQLPGN